MWPGEVGMFVVAPATSFHQDPSMIDHLGVIPLLTDSVDLTRSRGPAIHFWQQQQQQQQQTNYFNKPASTINFDHNNSNNNNNLVSSGPSPGGSSAATCQDCGNQAKKDCTHRRCRTCCRSRGFNCSTHLRSTWVPAARRRERQIMGLAASSASTSAAKKPRLNTATTNSHTSNSETSSTHQAAAAAIEEAGYKETLPRQVRAPAVFKCVRVTAVEDGEDEYAYQAVVRIGGHVFKGFLYDQGAESGDGFPNLSDLHLGASSSSPVLDPPELYATSDGGFPYGN